MPSIVSRSSMRTSAACRILRRRSERMEADRLSRYSASDFEGQVQCGDGQRRDAREPGGSEHRLRPGGVAVGHVLEGEQRHGARRGMGIEPAQQRLEDILALLARGHAGR